jgi:aspartate/methionine/tyrosine aminotransferase
MVAEFRRRRDYLVPALNAIPGVTCVEPGGAFYVFPNVGGVPMPADELAERLLDEAGVAVLAGSAFGSHAPDNIRISYATSLPNLERAVGRIAAFVDQLS